MPKLTLNDQEHKVTIDVDVSADWLSCLIPALLAGLPGFLDAFIACIGGDGSSDKFKPGTRPRCG